ncbi:MAG: hypothetical protein AAGG69_03530 [Pseudomonadota bacterium]
MSESKLYFDLYTGILELTVEDAVSHLSEAAHLGWFLVQLDAANLPDRPLVKLRITPVVGELDLKKVGGQRRDTQTGVSVASDNERPDGPWIIVEDKAGLRLLENGHCEMFAETTSAEAAYAVKNAMIFAVSHAITGLGGNLLHAACLLTPDRDSIVILQAPSGTGKTTTSMALALSGFAITGDDTTGLLRADGETSPVMGWGVPRAAKVHRKTVAMLPDLAPLVTEGKWNDEDEKAIERASLIEAGLGAVTAKPLPIKAVIALAKPESDTDFQPTISAPFDALTKLLNDNLSAGAEGFFPSHDDLFTTLSELVARVPTFRVPVNGSPKEVAQRIASTVASL